VPTSVFFNNSNSYAEKNLIEDLIIESIRIYGHDVHYCPRTIVAKDDLYGADTLSAYNSQYLIEMYIKNVEGFEGEGDFLSKFNLQIRDSITFTVARRVFNQEIGEPVLLDRPREGDLIYFPLNGKVFVIKFVEHEPVFYQMGALQMYDLKCELFEYSSEKLNTGLDDIDKLETEWTMNVGNTYANTFANGDIRIGEDGKPKNVTVEYDSGGDNIKIQTDSDLIIDFSEKDPFSEGGTF
jgi:hypothetical protein